MNVNIQANGQEVLDIIDRVGQGLEWLGSKQMYVWRLEYSVEKLVEAKLNLECLMETVVFTMEDALHNGWWPLQGPAKAWIANGQALAQHANKVLTLYKEIDGGDDASNNVFLCPCEVMRRRTVNARVIYRMNRILDHMRLGEVYKKGGFEDVACKRGADDQDAMDPKAIRRLLKAQASRSLNYRIAALLAPDPGRAGPRARRRFAVTSQQEVESGRTAVCSVESSVESHAPAVLDSGRASQLVVTSQHEALAASSAEKVQLSAFTKYRALARSQSHESVPVVIRVKGPRYSPRSRAPIDLVLVLDVSGGMSGRSQELLRMSSMFAVHNLEATDRLCIVRGAESSLPLRGMSGEGKRLANRFISSTWVAGSGGEGEGDKLEPAMEAAYKVLRERAGREDRVSGILVLTNSKWQGSVESTRRSYAAKHPAAYVIGVGPHDSRSLGFLATDGCYGTYSFAMEEELESVREAMAVYIGGLTSVVARDVGISVHSAHPGVRISGMTCGGYRFTVDGGGDSGSIAVRDLYGGEEKDFLVYVDVPREQAAGGIFAGTPKTKLLTVKASYYSPLTGATQVVGADAIEVAVDRPGKVRGQDAMVSALVAGEVIRAKALVAVQEIWRQTIVSGGMDDDNASFISNNWPAAAKKLKDLRDSIDGSEEAKAAEDRWVDLRRDLSEMATDSSVAYMLSWLSSHRWQRAATPGSTSRSKWFRTVRMQNMIASVESAPSSFL